MALIAWPAVPHPWLDDWLIWRFAGGSRPANVPSDLRPFPYTAEVLRWVTWRRKGRPEPRPDVVKNIPDWAYDTLSTLNKAVPVALPSQPHDWVLPWAIWRFRGSPPESKPVSVPDNLSLSAPYVWSFLRWAGWRRKNPLPSRPSDIPTVIPEWAWSHLKKINIAVPPWPPAPPPPPSPPPVPPSSWTLPNPIMFTTWGFMTDSDFRNVDVIAQRMRNAGVRTVLLQIGQYPENVPGDLREYGFKIALWGSPSADDERALREAQADGYMPQIEGPGEFQAAITNLEAGIGAGLSLSIVTTLAGLETFTTSPSGQVTTVEAERLKAAGVTHAWVECYKQGGPSHFPISKMEWSLKHRGIPHFNPLIGLYWDVPVSDYFPDLLPFGKQCGAYTAETMRPQDWADFAALGT